MGWMHRRVCVSGRQAYAHAPDMEGFIGVGRASCVWRALGWAGKGWEPSGMFMVVKTWVAASGTRPQLGTRASGRGFGSTLDALEV